MFSKLLMRKREESTIYKLQIRFVLVSLLFCVQMFSAVAQSQYSDKAAFRKAPKPILIQSTGYSPPAESQASRAGERVFKDLNCMACHSIHNVGGTYGPLLDGVGAHRSASYLYAHLANSEEQKKVFAQMNQVSVGSLRHPRVSEDTAKNLVAYLQSLPEPAGGFVLYPHIRARPAEEVSDNPNFKPAGKSKESLEGKEIYDKSGCTACHSIDGIGGWLGPRLDGVGGRRKKAEILEYINTPAAKVRESTDEQEYWPQMPKFNLSKDQVEKLSEYLLTLPNLPK